MVRKGPQAAWHGPYRWSAYHPDGLVHCALQGPAVEGAQLQAATGPTDDRRDSELGREPETGLSGMVAAVDLDHDVGGRDDRGLIQQLKAVLGPLFALGQIAPQLLREGLSGGGGGRRR